MIKASMIKRNIISILFCLVDKAIKYMIIIMAASAMIVISKIFMWSPLDFERIRNGIIYHVNCNVVAVMDSNIVKIYVIISIFG